MVTVRAFSCLYSLCFDWDRVFHIEHILIVQILTLATITTVTRDSVRSYLEVVVVELDHTLLVLGQLLRLVDI
jgi:hypothetical protein